MEKVLGLGKKKVRAGNGAERGEPGDMTSEDHKVRRQGKQVSRRNFLGGAVAAGAAVGVGVAAKRGKQLKDTGEAALRAALDAGINAREPIPRDLQPPIVVSRRGRNPNAIEEEDGYGHSIMKGEGAGDIPIVERVADKLRDRDVAAESYTFARKASSVDDLPHQLANAKKKLPRKEKGRKRRAEILTGGNEYGEHPDIVADLQSVARDPWQPRRWARIREQNEEIQRDFGSKLGRHTAAIARETDADSVVLYTVPNEQYARQIVQIGNKGKATKIPIAGDSTGAKLRQFLISIFFVRRGTQEVIRAARSVKKQTGKAVTVIDTAAAVKPQDYTNDDQHFGRRGADNLANARMRKTQEED